MLLLVDVGGHPRLVLVVVVLPERREGEGGRGWVGYTQLNNAVVVAKRKFKRKGYLKYMGILGGGFSKMFHSLKASPIKHM